MKFCSAVLCCFLVCGRVLAQKPVWQPSPGHSQMPIWPGAVPDPQPTSGPEFEETTPREWQNTGKPATGISNVTRPTMTVYSPKGNNTGVAVVVFPGGGYQGLAIDLEGTEVYDWLVPRGITCVLLKYRITAVGPYPKSGPYPESPIALEDAQRTVGLVRFHAAQLHIDPHKIGVLGFSSGGHLVAAISTHYTGRIYPPIDAADKVSCRPDFAIPIYPGHLSLAAAEWDTRQGKTKYVIPASLLNACKDHELCLNPEVPVTNRTPPTFLLQNEDDHTDNVDDSLLTTSLSGKRGFRSRCICMLKEVMPLDFAARSFP